MEEFLLRMNPKMDIRFRGFISGKQLSHAAREHTGVPEAVLLENDISICIFDGKINRLFVSQLLKIGHFHLGFSILSGFARVFQAHSDIVDLHFSANPAKTTSISIWLIHFEHRLV